MTQPLHSITSATTPPLRSPRSKRRGHSCGLIALTVATLGILAYMLSPYIQLDISTNRVPVHGSYLYYSILVLHIFTAAVASVTGLLQLWPWLRRTHPTAHRWAGRAYFHAGVFPTVVVIIPLATLSHGGTINAISLFVMGGLLALTGVRGHRAARARKFADHRMWMIRNYAVLLASIASRVWALLIGLAFGALGTFDMNSIAVFYMIVSMSTWLALLTNVLAVEVYLRRGRHAARSVAAGSWWPR